jgi:hypothetical protein
MVEVRDGEHQQWQLFELEHVMPDHISHRFIVLLHGTRPQEWSFFREARIRTSPLPEGWLPDDWRVLGDEEIPTVGDCVVFSYHVANEFNRSQLYQIRSKGNYTTWNAKRCVEACTHHLCVIRPRWRKVTKDDVGKHVSSGIDMGQLKIILNEPDDDGHDCIVYFGGWCVSALKDLKVENEGWHVTK